MLASPREASGPRVGSAGSATPRREKEDVMRPRMMMWRRAHGAGCCGEGRVHPDHHHFSDPGWEGGGPFGVRRPLRFLAWKLGLDDPQIAELAAILDTLKTERA